MIGVIVNVSATLFAVIDPAEFIVLLPSSEDDELLLELDEVVVGSSTTGSSTVGSMPMI